ncbi:Protein CBG14433 [Caenorhabditis briggsae]|uniref:Protein CBG14433 n=1 Tax=Caenorhabditis briggsae TaxID=6238 RepID=A8XJY7_CAEBR|nr:Protein CBG14433 [Caenorhabditis briggsae]CAP32963.1 Protein CBG14433 [Caenorhabditis briggsae]
MNRQTFGEYSTPDGPPELKRQRDPDSDLEESEDSEQLEHSKDDMSPQLQPELPDDLNRLLDKEDYDFGNAIQNWMEDPDHWNFRMDGPVF